MSFCTLSLFAWNYPFYLILTIIMIYLPYPNTEYSNVIQHSNYTIQIKIKKHTNILTRRGRSLIWMAAKVSRILDDLSSVFSISPFNCRHSACNASCSLQISSFFLVCSSNSAVYQQWKFPAHIMGKPSAEEFIFEVLVTFSCKFWGSQYLRVLFDIFNYLNLLLWMQTQYTSVKNFYTGCTASCI